MTQITRDSGLTHQPSISADGNFVVYASDRATGKDMDIWIQHVSGGQPVRLTSTLENEVQPSLSADGRKVAFQRGSESIDQGIFVIPALGGTPRLLASKGLAPQISPDGKTVAFATGSYMQQSEVRVASTEHGPARTVPFDLKWAMGPIWVRDGKSLLLWTGPPACAELRGTACDYWILPASGGVAAATGVEKQLAKAGSLSMLQNIVAWTLPASSEGPDGLVTAAQLGDGYDLWLIPMPGGKAAPPVTRITVGAGAANPSVAASTGRIAFARRSGGQGLWMLPIEAATGRGDR